MQYHHRAIMATNGTSPSSAISSVISSILSSETSVSSSAAAVTTSSNPVNPITTTSSSRPVTASSIPPTTSSIIPTTTSIISISPTSTTFVAPSTTTVPTVVSTIETTVTRTSSSSVGTSSSIPVTTIISTQTTYSTTGTRSSTRTSTSSTASPLSVGSSGSGSSGLSTSGKIAVAVVIPIVVIAAALIFGIFFWRRRKARKNTAELRKNEMAEYGFNPNNDPSLAAVGAGAGAGAVGAGVAGAAYNDRASELADDSGYRGWGTTNSNTRKPSTTMGSTSRAPNGMAFSDGGSQPGGYKNYPQTPHGASDGFAGDPLFVDHPERQDALGALGGAAVGGGLAAAATRSSNRNSQPDVRRGPSNASSSYSRAPHSDSSGDGPHKTPYVQDNGVHNASYSDASPTHEVFGDTSYNDGDGEPVIRDVQAKRNTRIERAPTFPHTQGGIAQNF